MRVTRRNTSFPGVSSWADWPRALRGWRASAACAKLLAPRDLPLPGYIHITRRGASSFNKQDAGFLGPKYGSITLADGKPPANLLPPASLRADAERLQVVLRDRWNGRFAQGHK